MKNIVNRDALGLHHEKIHTQATPQVSVFPREQKCRMLTPEETLSVFHGHGEQPVNNIENIARAVLTQEGFKRFQNLTETQQQVYCKLCEQSYLEGGLYFKYDLPPSKHRTAIQAVRRSLLIKGGWDNTNKTWHGWISDNYHRSVKKIKGIYWSGDKIEKKQVVIAA